MYTNFKFVLLLFCSVFGEGHLFEYQSAKGLRQKHFKKLTAPMSTNNQIRDYYKYLVKVQTGSKICSGILLNNNIVATTSNCALQNFRSKKVFVYENGNETEYNVNKVVPIDVHPDALEPHTPVLLEINRNEESFPIEISSEKYQTKDILVDSWETGYDTKEYYKDTAKTYILPTVPFEKCEKVNNFHVTLDSYQIGSMFNKKNQSISNLHLGTPAFDPSFDKIYKLSGLLTACFDNVDSPKNIYTSFVDLSYYRNNIISVLEKSKK